MTKALVQDRTRPARPRDSRLSQLLRFGMVGGVGFAVDAGVLLALTALGGAPLLMRVLSFAAAVVVTWALNRRWTFAATEQRGREFLAYLTVQSGGMVVNFAVFAAVLTWTAQTPLIALAAGSALATAVNFTGARIWVFGSDRLPADP